MSGFEKTKFLNLPKSLEEELMCGICLNILNNPMTTPCCRQSYCKQCILQCLHMSSNPNICPNDRKTLLSRNLIQSSRTVTNILDKQEVYCDHRNNGCPQIVELSQLVHHLNECSFDPNKAFNKCHQILNNLEVTVGQMKNKIKSSHLKKDFEQLKTRINVCRHELNVMNSNKVHRIEQQLIEPNGESFKNNVIESAKINVENPVIVSAHMSDNAMKDRVINVCKEAINGSNDYDQLAQCLLESLNTYYLYVYEWSVYVYPIESSVHIFNNFSHKIEVSFGKLCILVSTRDEYSDDDDSDDYNDEEEDEEHADDFLQNYIV